MIAGGAATKSGCAEPSRLQARRHRCRTRDGLDIASGLQDATAVLVSARKTYSLLPCTKHGYAAYGNATPERRDGMVSRGRRADTYLVSAYWAYSLSLDTDETAVNPRLLCSLRPRRARPGLAFGSRGPAPRITACGTPTVPATRSRSSSVAASNLAARQWRQERAAGQDALRAPPVRMDASTLLVSFGVPRESRSARCWTATGRQPGDCPQGEQLMSGGRRWRPVFRLGGRSEARPGSEKPVKAEPMKDEIRLSGKKPRENSPDEG